MKKKLKQLKRQRIDVKRGLKTKARKHLTTKNSITARKGGGWVEIHGKKPMEATCI